MKLTPNVHIYTRSVVGPSPPYIYLIHLRNCQPLLLPLFYLFVLLLKIGNKTHWFYYFLCALTDKHHRLCSERQKLMQKRKVLQKCFLVWKEALKSFVTLRYTQNVYRLKCKRLVNNDLVSSPSMFLIRV